MNPNTQPNANWSKTPNTLTPLQMRVGKWALVAAGTLGVLGMAIHKNNEVNDTQVPTRAEAEAHPDHYRVRKVEAGETLDGIAKEYTDSSHDYRAASDHLADQNGGSSNVQAGQELEVPVTTVPVEDRK